VTAAAPAYLAANGVPQHPRDVLTHPCIRHRFAHGVMHAWEYERGNETLKVSPTGPLVANSIDLELAAAIAGIGLIATFEELTHTAVDAGQLVLVLEDWSVGFSGPLLYYAGRRHLPAPLRAFIDFLKA
jgi:DNA-binding transcriptional LysR family regulator